METLDELIWDVRIALHEGELSPVNRERMERLLTNLRTVEAQWGELVAEGEL